VEKDYRRLTKMATWVACLLVMPAMVLSLPLDSNVEMSGSVFFATWGVMLGGGLIGFLGYFVCQRSGREISPFYAICPVLLASVFLFRMNFVSIVRELGSP
jgi:hypothetical protein